MPAPTNEALSISPDVPRDEEQHFKTDHLLNDLHGRSFRGGVVTLAGQAINFLLQMGATVILARLLVPQDFGLIAMVMALTGFVGLFKDIGLSTATIQRAEITHAQISFLFWVNVALSCAVTLVVAASAPAVAWFYHEQRLTLITFVLALNFLFSGLTVQHQALLRRRMQFRVLAIIDTTANACGFATGIIMAWLGFGFWSLVGLRSVTSVVNCLLVWTRCSWRPGLFRMGVGARPMLAFGRNITGYNVLNYFTRNFDNILIGRILGSGPLGIYSKAYGLLLLPIGQINIPVSAVLLPGLSRLQNKPKEYAVLFLSAARALALITVPIVVFSFFFAPDVTLVILGRRWMAAARVFQLLAPAAVLGAIGPAPNWLCQSLGRTDRQLHYALVSAPVYIIGFLIGIRWGIEGVATSFSVTFSVLFWIFVWYSSRESPIRFSEIVVNFIAAFAPSVAAASLVWILRGTVLIHAKPSLALLISAVAFALCYVALLLLSKSSRRLVVSGIAASRKVLRA